MVLFALCEPAQALDVAVVEQVKRATVLLRVPGGEGSGFFVGDALVLTNAHVVQGLGLGGIAEVVLDSGTRTGVHVPGRVVDLSPEADLALVEVPAQPGRALVSGTAAVIETQEVVSAGFPLGSVRTFGGASGDPPVSLRPGSVTALHRDDAGEVLYVEHNTNMQVGSSGGPLVDARGEVVGVNVAMMQDDATTKLAIPAVRMRGYLAAAAARLTAPAVPSPDGAPATPGVPRPVLRTEVARPFEDAVVRELAVAPGGDVYVLFVNGAVLLLRDEREWVDIQSGFNNRDIAVDDFTGELYAVESDTARVMHRRTDGAWESVGDGKTVQVAASAGRLWTLSESGELFRRDGGTWTDLNIGGTEEVIACGGVPFLRVGASIWYMDGDTLANDGKPVIESVKQMECRRDRLYGLMDDGTVRDLLNDRLIDASTDNSAIYATNDGLLARTRDGGLWYWAAVQDAWIRVEAP